MKIHCEKYLHDRTMTCQLQKYLSQTLEHSEEKEHSHALIRMILFLRCQLSDFVMYIRLPMMYKTKPDMSLSPNALNVKMNKNE